MFLPTSVLKTGDLLWLIFKFFFPLRKPHPNEELQLMLSHVLRTALANFYKEVKDELL